LSRARASLWILLALTVTPASGEPMLPRVDTLDDGARLVQRPERRLVVATRSESFAKALIRQAADSGNGQHRVDSGAGKAAVESKAHKDPDIPGAIVALIFGVFGLLVVSRRRVR
jgi:hypothetical protein